MNRELQLPQRGAPRNGAAPGTTSPEWGRVCPGGDTQIPRSPTRIPKSSRKAPGLCTSSAALTPPTSKAPTAKARQDSEV